ncbi:MAG: AAA family ATPase [Candidatus Odinarchaeota archaeon]
MEERPVLEQQKQLTIQSLLLDNFMTFKTARVDFETGYNVIVGFNGSGKTSLFHALQFVLATSEKQGRYTSWRDFITWGEEKATVVLELRNGDGSTTSLSRTLSRRGTGSYFINGKKSSFSTVKTFIRNLSINPADPLVMVPQGSIARLVNLDPAYLLHSYEQAIGLDVIRNKIIEEREKMEFLKTSDLPQAREAVEELKHQLSLLDASMERLKLKRQLEKRQSELNRYKKLQEYRTWLLENDEATSRIIQIEKELNNLQTDHQAITSDVKQSQTQKDKLATRLTVIRKDHFDKQAQYQSLKSTLEYNQQQLFSLEKQIRGLKTSKGRIQSKIVGERKELDDYSARLSEVDENRSRLAKDTNSKLEHLEQINTEFEGLVSQQKKVKNELDQLTNKLNEVKSEEMAATNLLKRQEPILDQLARERSLLEQELKEHGITENDVHSTEQTMSKVNSLKRERFELEIKIRELFQEENDLRKAINSNLRLFPRNLLPVIENIKKSGRDITGPLIDFLEPVDESLATALGSALTSERMFAFTCWKPEDIHYLVQLRRDFNARFAIFRPKKDQPQSRTFNLTGPDQLISRVIGHLPDLVRYPAELEPIIREMFTGTFIVETLEDANKLAEENRVTFITLEGERLVSRKHVDELPSYRGKSRFPVGRKQLEERLADLERQTAVLQLKSENLAKELVEQESCLNKLQELSVKSQKLEEIIQKSAIERVNFSELENRVNSSHQAAQKLEMEISDLSASVPDLSRYLMVSRELQKSITENNSQLKDLEKLKQVYSSKYQIIAKKVTELEKELELKSEEILKLDEQLERLTVDDVELERLRNLEKDIEVLQKDIENLEIALTAATAEHIKRENALANLQFKLNHASFQLESNKKVLTGLEKKIKDFEQEIEPEFQGQKVFPSLHEIEAELKAIDVQLQAYRDVDDSVEIRYNELLRKAAVAEKDLAVIENNIITLEKTIPSLESNYNRKLKEGVPELESELDSILKKVRDHAKSSVIIEGEGLDLGIHLKTNFGSRVQKQQEIKILSGGEQTVVSIAFLLALQAFDPSPVRVFDEFDVFLDPENTRIVTELIKNSSKRTKTQFIVLTPAKSIELIEPADKVIGVARPPGKPSCIVGVEFT